jgi:hypothetical protein
MRHLMLAIALVPFGGSASGEEGWIVMFNGRDLAGWRANAYPDSYAVENGLLRLRCSAADAGQRSHLFFAGDAAGGLARFKNFELRASVRAEPDSNSGIFFHTTMRERDENKHLADGYEVQLNSSQREKRKTGSLYAVVDLLESPVDESKWFLVDLRVEGKRILVKLDGKTVVDYTEPANPERPPERKGRLLRPEGGAIALQAHDNKSTWYVKDIRIRRLPD